MCGKSEGRPPRPVAPQTGKSYHRREGFARRILIRLARSGKRGDTLISSKTMKDNKLRMASDRACESLASDPRWRDRVRVILVRPEHPGNVGAAARAMKNMGYRSLHLVAPLCGHLTPDALKMAYGARDVLDQVRIHATLGEAVASVRWVAGFTVSRPGRPTSIPLADVAPDLAGRAHTVEVALLFGSEISGLSNDELAVCQQIVSIPSDPDQPSLNLAQAVLLACYELKRTPNPIRLDRVPATVDELEGLQSHLAETLAAIGFLHPPHDRHLVHDLRALIHRAQLDSREVRILRGILRQARWARVPASHQITPP